MTRQEAVEVVETRLGQRTGLYPRIVVELQAAQRHFEAGAILPWFLRVKEPITATASFVDLPTGFIREIDDETGLWIWPDATKRLPLGKDNYETLARSEDLWGTGLPKFYSLGVTGYELFPAPDQSYALDAVFYKRDAVLDDDLRTNLWLTHAPSLLISRAGLQMARALRSVEAITLFTADMAEAMQAVYTSGITRDMAARSLEVGG